MLYLSSDVGGTFTDLVLVDAAAGKMMVDKVPSSGRSADAIVLGIGRLLQRAGRPIGDVASFIHSSTIATNAWLTRRGSNAVLLVTRGFRDVLEIGTQRREHNYMLTLQRPPALIPRSRVIEVAERIDAFGAIVEELEEEEIDRIVELLRKLDPDAVAVSLLFSFKNDAHEKRLAEAIRNRLNRAHVYSSCTINPQLGEYLRANTTAAAAYVGPEIDDYIASLGKRLSEISFTSPLMLMRSDGGVATPEAVRENPASMLLSGPSGGVIASAALGNAIGVRDLVTFDMGGTSADFSLIAEGKPRMSTDRVIKDQVLRLPMLDIETISSGGGSVATVDHAGALHVGPQSAGADPGPACYGKGGDAPTLTDAAVVLGILDPMDFAGGDIKLDLQVAHDVIRSKVATPLRLSVEDAAIGMIAVACSQMRQAIRALTIERGHDLRRFSLLAFGGAGPIFASFMEKDLGVEQVLVPPRPGVFAALGVLLADIRHNAQAVFTAGLAEADRGEMAGHFAEMERRLDAALDRDGVRADRRSFLHAADLRYQGQFHDITVPFDVPEDEAWSPAVVAERFHRMHNQAYGHCDPESAIEIVNLRLEAVGCVDKPSFRRGVERAVGSARPHSSRSIIFERGGARRDSPVFRRDDLLPGHELEGPAIVSQSDTTVLLLPGQSAQVDDHGVIRIRSRENAR
jgi:N-methylhydantoinase A